MKLIGYTNNEINNSEFLDEVIKFTDFADITGDYAVDVSAGELIYNVKSWIYNHKDVGAFYGDFIDKDGNYCLHSMFPSIRTMYPGIIYKSELLHKCVTSNPLEEIGKAHIISYIPIAIFRIFE